MWALPGLKMRFADEKKPAGAGGQKFLVTSSFAGTSLGGDTVIQTTRRRCKILLAEC
ncbi:protein of unknown function [Serratia sp. Tan611]|nr:protein of unknown function [Serratia sp. Tan611]